MNRSSRERILLVVLLLGLVLAVWRVWGSVFPGTSRPASSTSATALSGVNTDPFSSVELPDDWMIPEGGGARDPFRYGAAPAPPPPPPPPPPPTPTQTFSPPPTAQPPPPPPLPLRYIGHGRSGGAGAVLRAILRTEDDPTPRPVSTGEVFLGRYRIEEVSAEFVVVEDIQSSRRERLPFEAEE